MRFEPNSMIIPAENTLYVVNRKGTTVVRSKNIHKVHEALRGHINVAIDRDALVSRIAEPHRSVVERYLETMSSAGAIRLDTEAPESDDDGLGRNEPILSPQSRAISNPRRSISVGGRRVFISLDGIKRAAVRDHDVCVFFVSREEAAREALSFGGWNRHGCAVAYVLVDPPLTAGCMISEGDLGRRDIYARWLLSSSSLSTRTDSPLLMFRLDARAGTLSRVIEGTGQVDLSGIPQRLELVRPADVEQVPLVVATASHPLFDLSLTAVGLRFHDLCEELAHEFIARASVIHCAGPNGIRMIEKGLDEHSDARRRHIYVSPEAAASYQVAPTLLNLEARLLELHAERTLDANAASSHDVDLLKEDRSHRANQYLKDILSLRFDTIPARLLACEDGLFIYERGASRCASFSRTKALRDILLTLTWETFYDARPIQVRAPTTSCDLTSFMSRARVKQVVRARERTLSTKSRAARVLYRRFHRWGRAAWLGEIEVQ